MNFMFRNIHNSDKYEFWWGETFHPMDSRNGVVFRWFLKPYCNFRALHYAHGKYTVCGPDGIIEQPSDDPSDERFERIIETLLSDRVINIEETVMFYYYECEDGEKRIWPEFRSIAGLHTTEHPAFDAFPKIGDVIYEEVFRVDDVMVDRYPDTMCWHSFF